MKSTQYVEQCELEKKTNKNNLYRRYKEIVLSVDSLVRYIDAENLDLKLIIHFMVTMLIYKRCEPSTLLGLMRSKFDTAQETADFIEDMLNRHLVKWDGERFITLLSPSDEVQKEIDMYQYPLPLLIKPRRLKENNDTGYYQSVKKSLILRQPAPEEDIYIECLNKFNKIPLTINKLVADNCENTFPHCDFDEDPDGSKFKALVRYQKSSKQVQDLLIEKGNKFYLTHSYDKRGRVYCNGYAISYQSTDYNKSIIEFANKELINGM